jgi:hypothetical protein
LDATDVREEQAAYKPIELAMRDVKLLTPSTLAPNPRIRAYLSDSSKVALPNAIQPIVQSYVDVYLGGALEIEASDPTLKAEGTFALSVCQSTRGWNGHWLNDR